MFARSMLRGISFFALVASVVSGAPFVHAQAPPSFEVASIKQNRLGQAFTRFGVQPGGRFVATNASLRELVRIAFQLEDFQIEGAPGWAGSDRFDVEAKAATDLPPLPAGISSVGSEPPVTLLMIRSLLADRFKLLAHVERRDAPIYALIVARADRTLGRQLSPSTVDCLALRASRGRVSIPPPPPAPPAPGDRPAPCTAGGGRGHIGGGAMPLTTLVASLTRIVGRTVIDRTGLSGNFDYVVDYASEVPVAPGAAAPNGQPNPSVDGPSIFTALQEQLGLKLEAQRGPVQFLVIDHVERPTED